MPTLREIKRRIRGVKNIAQVTRAMQTVSAAKMRRAQEQARASRYYAQQAWEILSHLANQPDGAQNLHPLLVERPVSKICVILITADRGLAGAYNSNVIRLASRFIREQETPVEVIAVGKRGRDLMRRFGYHLSAEFIEMPDRPGIADVLPIARIVLDDFLAGKFDQIFVAYTDFINTVTLEPALKQILPLSIHTLDGQAGAEHLSSSQSKSAHAYIYEPDPETLLDTILPRFIEWQIYQALLEAQASEHSARMVAMRNATDNATELAGDLNLLYNRARQEAITKEMLDIAGGAEALLNV